MGSRGRNGGYFTIGVARFSGQHANDYRRDVVVAAVDVRFLDQSIDDALWFRSRQQQLLNPAVIDHAGQSIAGQQERVADAGIPIEHIRLDLVSHANATGNDVALWMTSRLL